MARERITSDTVWEAKYGYCRAIKAGDRIFVSGCAPVAEDGSTFSPFAAYDQTIRCLEIGLKAVTDLGGELMDIVRTRMYVTDIEQAAEYGRAHGEVFKDHPPACTMVEISKLIEPDMTIEIELEAILNA
ncbi:MAG: RidA family protein [Planctomycetes bacterium]|nr:RidA family protein [Planctomycetota bacterium]